MSLSGIKTRDKVFIEKAVAEAERFYKDLSDNFDSKRFMLLIDAIERLPEESAQDFLVKNKHDVLKLFSSLRDTQIDVGELAKSLVSYVQRFEALAADEERNLTLKRKEHNIEAWYDWYEKLRTFLFRAFGAVLLIATLFTIGYIEKTYDWATLPLAPYLKSGLK